MHNLWLLTPQLELLAASQSLARLEVRSLEGLGKRLECRVSPQWREIMPLENAEFCAARLLEHPEDAGWWNWYGVTLEPERVLAVSASFCGWPNEGKIWIGCNVAPEFRGRRLATEAVDALCKWAFRHGVLTVGAQIEEGNLSSRRMLERCGFALCESRQDAHDGPVILEFERQDANWNAICSQTEKKRQEHGSTLPQET